MNNRDVAQSLNKIRSTLQWIAFWLFLLAFK